MDRQGLDIVQQIWRATKFLSEQCVVDATSHCRRTVDHTGPYVRMLLERLRTPKSLSVMPPTPTAAGALQVPVPRLPHPTVLACFQAPPALP